MKIISSYWASTKEQEISESVFLNHVQNFKIEKVFIGFKQIKNFKIEFENGRMILRYALVKNASLKYYANLLNHSIAVKENTAVFLNDKNWADYKKQLLNENTLKLLN